MKVLHVLHHIGIGGISVVAQGLTSALAKSGTYCEIATVGDYEENCDKQLFLDIPTHYFSIGLFACWWPFYSPPLARFLSAAARQFDLIHIHGAWYYNVYAAFRAARKHNIPYVLSLHGALAKNALQYKEYRKRLCMLLFQRSILESAAAIHCLTEAERSNFERLGIETPTFTVPNGIPSDLSDTFARTDPSGFLARFPVLANKRIILFMGLVCIQKGLVLLARSFVRVASRFPDVALLVAGPDGRDGAKSRMEAILREAGPAIRERVIFAGPLSGYEWRAAYACAGFLVLPSRSEGFSLVLLEAMAAGLPVVVSKHVGILPLVVEAGLVTRLEDEPLAKAMAALLSDRQRTSRMGQNGRRLAANYTWPVIARSMTTHYSEISERSRKQGLHA